MSTSIDLATALSALRAAWILVDENDSSCDDRPTLPDPVGPSSPWTPGLTGRRTR